MEPDKTSSYKLPSGEVVDVVYIRLQDGRIVPRHPSEVLRRPTPPPATDKP